jgi:cytochrome c2/plastocyanin
MADRGDTLYHLPSMNRWFLFSSAFFLFTMVWTVLDDASPEWKNYQREFRNIELEQAEAALEELSEEGLIDQEAALQTAVDGAQVALDAQGDRIGELEAEHYAASESHRELETEFKSGSANVKWMIFNYERDAVLKTPSEVADALLEIESTLKENNGIGERVEALEEARDALGGELEDLRQALVDADKDLATATADLVRVREKIESLDPAGIAEQLAMAVRDMPGLDFVGPNLKVRKYVLDGIDLDLNFTKKPRIDMCTTCHMGIDREGFEDAPQPFTTHPDLDLYLSSKSPHPAKVVGCTSCHRGSGESLSFQHADHRPSDAAEAAAWEAEHHWHKQHHWDYPMLADKHTEAGCVQCHKTSMELIAPDAPELTEGYRLVERYGCYACHKIDWFPTKRRPGPSLLGMRGKLQSDWVESWIAHPREFRPTTWMPQVFHVENYPANEEVVVSEYGQGRSILGGEWNDNAVAAITEFLFANHEEMNFPPLPLVGDAERGREVMNLVGCYSCHNTGTYDGEESVTNNLSEQPGRYNQHGPNLRGVNTKVSAEWLFAWIKDPKAYWGGTQMPNLRLNDRDAVDITAYIMEDPDGIFGDTPEGWSVGRKSFDREVLEEQARWFFQKEGRAGLAARFAGEWAEDTALAAAVGKAFVMNQGCYSCHEIAGMAAMMPIGAELTKWASKTVDKLDFGMSYEHDAGQKKIHLADDIVAQARNQTTQDLPWLDHHYNDGWLKRKLAHPRSFDIDKVKNPKERLRMPWFDFTDGQIDAIATFILGLVNDDVPGQIMHPSADKLAFDAGARAVRQKNCVACHVVDQPRITFEDAAGHERTIAARFLRLPDEPAPPVIRSMEDFSRVRAEWEEYYQDDYEEGLEVIDVTLMDVHPDVGAPNEAVEIPVDKLRAVQPSYGGDFVELVRSYYADGVMVANPDYDPNDEDSYPSDPWTWLADDDGNPLVEDNDGVGRFYQETELDKLRWTFAPPILVNEGHKLQRDWFYSFLQDPYPLRQQMRVRMPSFHFYDGEAESIADYFAVKARQEWAPRYARTARLTLGRKAKPELLDGSTPHRWDLETRANEWPTVLAVAEKTPGLSSAVVAAGADLTAAKVEAIEAGYAPEVAANFSKLYDWAHAQGFRMTGRLPHEYEQLVRQSPSHLEEFAERIPIGEKVAVEGVNCFECHQGLDGSYQKDPIAWAPALTNTQARLREEWVREWIWNPVAVYPGTSMPDNFSAHEPQYQEQYPGSSNGVQIDAIMDWLYNLGGAAPSQSVGQLNFDAVDDDQLLAILRSRGVQFTDMSDDNQAGEPVEEPEVIEEDEPLEEPEEEDAVLVDPEVEDPEVMEPETPVDPIPAPVAAGSLVGRVVYDGVPPSMKPLVITPDQAKGCCTDGSTVDNTDRSLMVSAGGGIQYVVVTLTVPGASAPAPVDKHALDQAKCRFEPHVSVVPVGTTLSFTNSDTVSHNIHTYSIKNDGQNKTIAAGGSYDMKVDKAEAITIGCDIHPWMKSYAVVTDATHWAVTDADGKFSFVGVPPGEYRLQFWHESLGKSKETVTVTAAGGSLEAKMSQETGRRRRR